MILERLLASWRLSVSALCILICPQTDKKGRKLLFLKFTMNAVKFDELDTRSTLPLNNEAYCSCTNESY